MSPNTPPCWEKRKRRKDRKSGVSASLGAAPEAQDHQLGRRRHTKPPTRFHGRHGLQGAGAQPTLPSAHPPQPHPTPPRDPVHPCAAPTTTRAGLTPPRGRAPGSPGQTRVPAAGASPAEGWARFHGLLGAHSHSSSEDENLPLSLCRGLHVRLAEGEGETGEHTPPHPPESPASALQKQPVQTVWWRHGTDEPAGGRDAGLR